MKLLTESTVSKTEVLDTTIVDEINELLAVSPLCRNAAYRVLISAGASNGVQRTVDSFLNTDTRPNIVNSSFLPPKWEAHINPFKEPLVKDVTIQALYVQGHISTYTA